MFGFLFISVVLGLLELYSSVLGQSQIVDDLFRKLKRVIFKEIHAQKRMMTVVGIMDLIFAQNSAAFTESPIVLNSALSTIAAAVNNSNKNNKNNTNDNNNDNSSNNDNNNNNTVNASDL